jgi:hypothetical protein
MRWTSALVVLGLSISVGACSDSESGEESAGQDEGIPTSSDESDESGASTNAEDTGMKLDVGNGSGMDTTAETGEECDQDVDIVFVMDVSTTMGPFLDQLEVEITNVANTLGNYNLPSEPHYGLVVFVDDILIANSGQAYTDVNQLRTDFEMWNDFTAGNTQTSGSGANTTWTENSLDAIYAGATAFPWRPADTTLRVVIHTTDDTFWDGPTTGNGLMIDHGYAETVQALQAGTIRFFSFAALIGGQTNTDDVSMGWNSPYMGMDPITDQTGGGWWNIDEVLAMQVSLSASIEQAIEDSLCEEYPPID